MWGNAQKLLFEMKTEIPESSCSVEALVVLLVEAAPFGIIHRSKVKKMCLGCRVQISYKLCRKTFETWIRLLQPTVARLGQEAAEKSVSYFYFGSLFKTHTESAAARSSQLWK